MKKPKKTKIKKQVIKKHLQELGIKVVGNCVKRKDVKDFIFPKRNTGNRSCFSQKVIADMENVKKFKNDKGVEFAVRVVYSGDKYGRTLSLTHSGEPLVEFYDTDHPHTEYGQFISRYSLPTILTLKNAGLNLDGSVPKWQIDRATMDKIISWLKTKKNESTASKKVTASGAPSVYVGTYSKYNDGSIDGKWLNLENYKDEDEFYAAARELHKDEEDPELMFQDFENFPKRFYGESSLAKELWDWLELNEDDRE